VREALIALEIESVIEVRTGSGSYVLKPKTGQPARQKTGDKAEWSPLELMRARELVASEVAALAARHAKKTDLQVIGVALQPMRDEVALGQIPRDGDAAFHHAIARTCGNEVLRDTVRGYWRARHGSLFEGLGDYFEDEPSWDAALLAPTEVFEAIRAHAGPCKNT
jgi:DNA-binding FadR family transcriptional regulator